MNYSLIRYNLTYYLKTPKFIGPLFMFIIFSFMNYNVKPIGIWNNCHITAIVLLILSSWISVSFVNSENKTQQYITRLHIRNELNYNLSKIISIFILVLPFYILSIFCPIVFGFYTRSLKPMEILVYLIINLLFSFIGIIIGLFFNFDIVKNKNIILPLQSLVILINVIPITVIFKHNVFIKYLAYLLLPLNYLIEKIYALNNDFFEINNDFMKFIIYIVVYSIAIIIAYNVIIRRKNKQ